MKHKTLKSLYNQYKDNIHIKDFILEYNYVISMSDKSYDEDMLLDKLYNICEYDYNILLNNIDNIIIGNAKTGTTCILDSIAKIFPHTTARTHGFCVYDISILGGILQEYEFNNYKFMKRFIKKEYINDKHLNEYIGFTAYNILGCLFTLYLVDNDFLNKKIILTVRDPISRCISSSFYLDKKLNTSNVDVTSYIFDDKAFYDYCTMRMDQEMMLLSMIYPYIDKVCVVSLDFEEHNIVTQKINKYLNIDNFQILKDINTNGSKLYSDTKENISFSKEVIDKIYNHELIHMLKKLNMMDDYKIEFLKEIYTRK